MPTSTPRKGLCGELLLIVLIILIGIDCGAPAASVTNSSPLTNEEKTHLQVQLAAYGKSVKLLPLANGMADELRVWSKDYIFGTVVGYVILNKTIRKCSIPVHDVAEALTVQKGRCVLPKYLNKAANLIKINELFEFNGRSLDCNVQDGTGVDVEGVSSGQWFAFHAENPDYCRDEGSALVSKLLRSLPLQFYK